MRAIALVTRRPVAAASLAVLAVFVAVALLADIVAAHGPLEQDAARRLLAPGGDHLFGTDGFGRDIFSRVVHGARVSLVVGFLGVGLAAVGGTVVGAASGYIGGKVDMLVQRVVDVFLGFPPLVLAMVILVALGPERTSLGAAVVSSAGAAAIALAPQVARLARATTLALRQEGYIEAARAIGASPLRVVGRHVLPNGLPIILAQVTGFFGAAIVLETSLSFLGLGIPPPYPSWGRMLNEGARRYFEVAPWATIFPGLALSAVVLSTAMLGDALRDIFDPRGGDRDL
ncbi:MAG: ABC transporter permease [SAR202 cluster bacterium]|nr:ABC transporter permease [SAR202 cluster bacterium]